MGLKIFSKNLKHLMSKKGISNSDLQLQMKLGSTSRIEAWREGRAAPRWRMLIDLCDALEYYDIYKLFTVDLRKTKDSVKKSPST